MDLNPKKFEIPSRDTYKLDGIRRIAARLGRPEIGRQTILVAGTNGKGSLCAYLTAAFVKKGLRVGTYSSPHIVTPEERIRLQGIPIKRKLLTLYERRYQKDLQSLTFFERWTMLAFLIFRDQGVDLQVLEVGMGGRLDATNISEPDLSLITTIGYDHQEVLGDTLSEIAAEKAGIMRKDRPVYLLPQGIEATKTLRDCAERTLVSQARFVKKGDLSPSREKLLEGVSQTLGREQSLNARLCLHALDFFKDEGRGLSMRDLREVFRAKSLWPGRLQIVSLRPLFILDGAHNENSARTLTRWLRTRFKGQKFHLIFGVMRDKHVEPLAKRLKPFVTSVVAPSFYPERELSPKKVARLWTSLKRPCDFSMGSVAECLKRIWPRGQRPLQNCLVAGSFYLVGAVLKELENRGEKLNDRRR